MTDVNVENKQHIVPYEVDAVIKELREENKHLLRLEREKMVSQIVESLQQFSMVNSKPLKTNPPQKSQTSTQENRLGNLEVPSHFDTNIVRLLHHSLSEDGLTYPHLFSKTKNEGNTINLLKNSSDQIVLKRTEKVDLNFSERIVANKARFNDPVANEGKTRRKVNKAKKRNDYSFKSPLSNIKVEKQKKKNNEEKTSQENKAAKVELVVDNNSEEPYKISNKTKIILNKSRALINDSSVKNIKVRRRKRKKCKNIELTKAHDSSDESDNVEASDANTVLFDRLIDEEEIKNARQIDLPGDFNNRGDVESKAHGERCTRSRDSFRLSLSRDSNNELSVVENKLHNEYENKQAQSMQSVLDEDAWENEIARQILNLYSSSIEKQPAVTQPVQSTKFAGETGPNVFSKGRHALPEISKPLRTKSKFHSTNSAWDPSHVENGKVVINIPKIPAMIWFSGTGTIKATWCILAAAQVENKSQTKIPNESTLCSHELCEELKRIESKGKVSKYVAIVEALLCARSRSEGIDELHRRLWRQLIVTCNAFAARVVDNKEFPLALELMKKASIMVDKENVLEPLSKHELRAYIADTYSYYYYRRGKYNASMEYLQRAYQVHEKYNHWSHLAKCELHLGNIYSKLGKHSNTVKSLNKILAMVEDDKFESGGSSAQKICLLSVCYHNLAITQLHLRQRQQACTSSDNARRLAKLCLSYSNRWLKNFENTHQAANAAVASYHTKILNHSKRISTS